jgi:hypothetical protein
VWTPETDILPYNTFSPSGTTEKVSYLSVIASDEFIIASWVVSLGASKGFAYSVMETGSNTFGSPVIISYHPIIHPPTQLPLHHPVHPTHSTIHPPHHPPTPPSTHPTQLPPHLPHSTSIPLTKLPPYHPHPLNYYPTFNFFFFSFFFF